jgi:hypothetical protein
MLLKDLTTLTASLASGTLFHVEKSGKAYNIDYTKLAKAIVEEYNGSTLGGSAQTVQAAIGALNSRFQHDPNGTPVSVDTLPSGFYFGVLSAATSPNGSVTWWNVYTDALSTGTQTATLYTGQESYTRARTGNSWGSWVKLPTRAEVDALEARVSALEN